MKPCLSEALTMASTFAEDVDACAAGGGNALEVWLTKLEQHLEKETVASTRRLSSDKNVTLAAASYQGGLLLSQGDARRAHFDHFKRRLDLCGALGIGTMLIAADFAQRPDATALERAVVSLRQAGQWAAGFGVTLALEFRGTDAFCSSLDTALQLVTAAQEPNIGVNLDVFHFYKGPSKAHDLALLTPQNLAFVQVCDVAGVPREMMTDSDRVLPGEGDFHLDELLDLLHALGYNGWVSVELLNPILWQMKASQVAEVAWSSVERLLRKEYK